MFPQVVQGSCPVSYTHLDVYKRQQENVQHLDPHGDERSEGTECGHMPALERYNRIG